MQLSRWTVLSLSLEHMLEIWTYLKKQHKHRKIMSGDCDAKDEAGLS